MLTIYDQKDIIKNIPKKIIWMGNSKKAVSGFPAEVKRLMGQALYFAQIGSRVSNTKMMKGFGSGVYEILRDYRTDTFRAVYTVQFAKRIYVLHVFQKKSKSGIKTPKEDIDLIKNRLKCVQEMENG